MRCRSCDKPLDETEIIWREEIQDHEDLCRQCRNIALGFDEDVLVEMDIMEDPHSSFEEV